MSVKTYVAPGIYYTEPTRGPLKGKKAYGARLWIKSVGGYRYFPQGTNLKEAQKNLYALAADPEKALASLTPEPVKERLTFAALVDAFLTTYQSRGRTDYYNHMAGNWRAYFGDVDADQITHARVEDYRDHLRRLRYAESNARKYSDSTIRKLLVALGTMFKCGPVAWSESRTSEPTWFVAGNSSAVTVSPSVFSA